MPPTVLIVENDLNISISLQFLMNRCGYETILVAGGEEAIEAVMQYQPDLILLDVMLPGINGVEVCEIVRLNPECQGIKIIFLSALDKGEDIVIGVGLGANDYIQKPYSNKVVMEKVKKLLEDSTSNALLESSLNKKT